jgi:hypothetical protein
VREGHADSGGSFYFAEYGVWVLQATNTLIAFKPSEAHGTSLLHRLPKDPAWFNGAYQMGLAIVSSPRLVPAFLKYKRGLLEKEKAEQELKEKNGDIQYHWGSGSAGTR